MRMQSNRRTPRRRQQLRGVTAAAGLVLAIASVVALGLLEWHWGDVDDTISASVAERRPEPELGKVTGRWRRSDGAALRSCRRKTLCL